MIRTHIEPCSLNREEADALNRASGERYTQVMVFHWRTYRKKGHWLSQGGAEKWNDRLNADQPKLLHAHSVDAAQQGFSKAIKAECHESRESKRGSIINHAGPDS
ncbi:MAG: hypothetical protein HC884_10035 [Chloroflexaceae bacterium]|nr:hypothetical protein [Chloroflexaceae bacterium]